MMTSTILTVESPENMSTAREIFGSFPMFFKNPDVLSI